MSELFSIQNKDVFVQTKLFKSSLLSIVFDNFNSIRETKDCNLGLLPKNQYDQLCNNEHFRVNEYLEKRPQLRYLGRNNKFRSQVRELVSMCFVAGAKNDVLKSNVSTLKLIENLSNLLNEVILEVNLYYSLSLEQEELIRSIFNDSLLLSVIFTSSQPDARLNRVTALIDELSINNC